MNKVNEFIKNKEERIKNYELQIKSLESILIVANSEVEKVGKHTRVDSIASNIKSAIQDLEKYRIKHQNELDAWVKLNRSEPVFVMVFKAGHNSFRPDELTEIYECLRKFDKIPYQKEIDSHMSDDGMLYVSEDIDIIEAQMLWDFIEKNQFDEQDNEIYADGDLLSWNGTEMVKIK